MERLGQSEPRKKERTEDMRATTHFLRHMFILQALINRLLYARCWGTVQSARKSYYKDLVGVGGRSYNEELMMI